MSRHTTKFTPLQRGGCRSSRAKTRECVQGASLQDSEKPRAKCEATQLLSNPLNEHASMGLLYGIRQGPDAPISVCMDASRCCSFMRARL